MKQNVFAGIGLVGSVFAGMFGGWDAGLFTLVLFMCIDYVTGLMIAGLFKKSRKSKNGKLDSRAGWQGLARKCMTLMFVLIAHRLDLAIGVTYIRDAVVIGFSANELVSIIENAGVMGLPLPGVIKNAVAILQQKGDEEV